MSTLRRVYRTQDGTADFEFAFSSRPFSNVIRIYVRNMPSYNGRATDGHSTHRYTDVNGAPYICYSPEPRNMTDAFKIAKAWAEATLRYIRTGQTF